MIERSIGGFYFKPNATIKEAKAVVTVFRKCAEEQFILIWCMLLVLFSLIQQPFLSGEVQGRDHYHFGWGIYLVNTTGPAILRPVKCQTRWQPDKTRTTSCHSLRPSQPKGQIHRSCCLPGGYLTGHFGSETRCTTTARTTCPAPGHWGKIYR